MKYLFFCKKCGKWSYQYILTANRCPYCGANLTVFEESSTSGDNSSRSINV